MTTTKKKTTAPLVVAVAASIDRVDLRKKLAAAGFKEITIVDCKRKEGVDILITPLDEPKLQKQYDDLHALLEDAQLNYKGPRIFSSQKPLLIISDVHHPAPPVLHSLGEGGSANQPSTNQPSTKD